uniref:Uncharacterized protein n=1 Tax=Arundo donax TaxID=35708 RepID=A0A0A8YR91_ARUDO
MTDIAIQTEHMKQPCLYAMKTILVTPADTFGIEIYYVIFISVRSSM